MRPLVEATLAGHGLDHLGFDGEVRDGMHVVHKGVPPEIVEIFRELFNSNVSDRGAAVLRTLSRRRVC